MRRSYIKKKNEERIANLTSRHVEVDDTVDAFSEEYHHDDDNMNESMTEVVEEAPITTNYNRGHHVNMPIDSERDISDTNVNVNVNVNVNENENVFENKKLENIPVEDENHFLFNKGGENVSIPDEKKLERERMEEKDISSIDKVDTYSMNLENDKDSNIVKQIQNKRDSNENLSVGDFTFDGEDVDNDVLQIPFQSIKRIMKIDQEVNMIARESYLVTGKVTEMFIEKLTQRSYQIALHNKRKMIRYEDVADARVNDPNLQFLEGVLPAV